MQTQIRPAHHGTPAWYRDEKIEVTNASITILDSQNNPTIYAVRGITSARMIEVPPDNKAAIAFMVVGGLSLFGMAGNKSLGESLSCLALGVIFGGVGLWMMLKSHIAYALIVVTSAGERQVIKSDKRDYVADLLRAVQLAITSQ